MISAPISPSPTGGVATETNIAMAAAAVIIVVIAAATAIEDESEGKFQVSFLLSRSEKRPWLRPNSAEFKLSRIECAIYKLGVFESFVTSCTALTETSSISSVGSFVVSSWKPSPGAMKTLRIGDFWYFPLNLSNS